MQIKGKVDSGVYPYRQRLRKAQKSNANVMEEAIPSLIGVIVSTMYTNSEMFLHL